MKRFTLCLIALVAGAVTARILEYDLSPGFVDERKAILESIGEAELDALVQSVREEALREAAHNQERLERFIDARDQRKNLLQTARAKLAAENKNIDWKAVVHGSHGERHAGVCPQDRP